MNVYRFSEPGTKTNLHRIEDRCLVRVCRSGEVGRVVGRWTWCGVGYVALQKGDGERFVHNNLVHARILGERDDR